jgi:oxygen-independent coproporphyrinogen-3 oxidase
MLAELQQVLAWIRANLMFHGDVGIEVYPQDIDKNTIAQLKGMGVNLVSVGVQTFNDWHLRFLGRGYSGNDARRSLELIKQANFDCVDIDIMFNLPGQTWEDIEHDLRSCYSYAIEQLSIYPLILFPLTALPQRVKKEKLHTFNSFQEYGLLRKIEVLSAQMGYSKTSIWTYGKYDSKRYTSITRESFVGIGASASSLFGKYFYLNTFNVEAYITRLATGRLPINLVNAMTPREKMIFWLFWRCYDTVIDTRRFKELFGVDFCQEFTFLAWFMQKAGLAKKIGHRFELTRLGSYLYHLVEKQYSLTYLNKMWSACMKNPWLEKFAL